MRKNVMEKLPGLHGELNISHLLGRNTHHLSGGELQRVASGTDADDLSEASSS